MKQKLIKIVFLPLLLFSAPAAGQDFSAFWEEYGIDEELLLILEYGGDRQFTQADFLGFIPDSLSFPSLSFAPTLSLPPASLPKVYLTSRFSGDKLRSQLFRIKTDFPSGWEMGLITESDEGEKWNDFYAGYVQKKSINYTVTVGNYSAGMGQGLILWRGFNWGVYPESPLLCDKHDFLRGYCSSGENGALFGGGVHYHSNGYSILAGLSASRWDASASPGGVGSILTSGLHTSETQKENQDRLREELAFAGIRKAIFEHIQVGFSGIYSRYYPPFAPDDSVREALDFTGGENLVMGAGLAAFVANLTSDLEIAQSESGGKAIIINSKIALEKAQAGITYLNCDEKFKNLRSLYQEGNIEQATLGTTFNTWPGGKINLLFDYYKRPWRTYNEEIPPANSKASICLEQNWNSQVYAVRIRRCIYEGAEGALAAHQYRFNWHTEVCKNLFGFRLEIIRSQNDDEHTGALLSMEWNRQLDKVNVSLSALAFKIPHYDCRIYHYQQDVPGAGSSPFYYGNGAAGNAVFNAKLLRGWTLALKAGLTYYNWRPNQEKSAYKKDFSLYLNYSGKVF